MKVLFGVLMFSIAIAACSQSGGDNSNSSPANQKVAAQDAQGNCTDGFLSKWADAKMAQQDWIAHGTQNFEDYLLKACAKYETFSSYKCKINCQVSGSFVQAFCPDKDGKAIDGQSTLDDCKYVESLKP